MTTNRSVHVAPTALVASAGEWIVDVIFPMLDAAGLLPESEADRTALVACLLPLYGIGFRDGGEFLAHAFRQQWKEV